jgi:hypothetical protein
MHPSQFCSRHSNPSYGVSSSSYRGSTGARVPRNPMMVLYSLEWAATLQPCASQPDSCTRHAFLNLSVQEISDFTANSSSHPFGAFATELPYAGVDLSVLGQDALLVCAVDIFRVDVPLLTSTGRAQSIYTRVINLFSCDACLIAFLRLTGSTLRTSSGSFGATIRPFALPLSIIHFANYPTRLICLSCSFS